MDVDDDSGGRGVAASSRVVDPYRNVSFEQVKDKLVIVCKPRAMKDAKAARVGTKSIYVGTASEDAPAWMTITLAASGARRGNRAQTDEEVWGQP